MSCKDKWTALAAEMESLTGVAAGSVEGVLRCNHAGCDKLVFRNKGMCLAGHAQDKDQGPGKAVVIEMAEAMLCLVDDLQASGALAEKDVVVARAVAQAQERLEGIQPGGLGQDQVAAANEAVEHLVEALDQLRGQGVVWPDDPRECAARLFLAVPPSTQSGQGQSLLAEYIDGKCGKPYKPKAAITKRWKIRVEPNEWHLQGEEGAASYLLAYGRGIGAPKCVELARHAAYMGYDDMARGFWKKAYELETGQAAPDDGVATQSVPALGQAAPAAQARATPTIEGLPDQLQPGQLVTMQPADAPKEREAYINDSAWWGQAKRDGERRLVMAGEKICYQARSLTIKAAPSPAIAQAMAQVVQQRGPFVLDGELYYLDAQDGEHRTAAQAITANANLGHVGEQPKTRYAIFKALYADGQDLTGRPESERIAVGESLGQALAQLTPEIEVLPTARTTEEKAALAARQKAEGREGEVWVRHDCTYTAGKNSAKRSPIVRTKYILETDVVIMGLTESTAEDRPFGAIEVGMYVGDKLVSMGAIGTGFTRKEMEEIAQAHRESPGQVVITVGSQGFTESDKFWHGRYRGIRTDKLPAECERKQ